MVKFLKICILLFFVVFLSCKEKDKIVDNIETNPIEMDTIRDFGIKSDNMFRDVNYLDSILSIKDSTIDSLIFELAILKQKLIIDKVKATVYNNIETEKESTYNEKEILLVKKDYFETELVYPNRNIISNVVIDDYYKKEYFKTKEKLVLEKKRNQAFKVITPLLIAAVTLIFVMK